MGPVLGSASLGVHVLVDRSGAGNARPAGPEPPAGLNELTLEDEQELRAFVSERGKAGPG